MKTSLKRKAESSEGTLREIFDEETNKSDFGGHVSFIDMENSMYKRRRLNRPTVPQDAEEAITLLNDCSDEFRTYLIFSINEPANREFAVGFMSPKWLTAYVLIQRHFSSRCNVLCCSKTILSASKYLSSL